MLPVWGFRKQLISIFLALFVYRVLKLMLIVDSLFDKVLINTWQIFLPLHSTSFQVRLLWKLFRRSMVTSYGNLVFIRFFIMSHSVTFQHIIAYNHCPCFFAVFVFLVSSRWYFVLATTVIDCWWQHRWPYILIGCYQMIPCFLQLVFTIFCIRTWLLRKLWLYDWFLRHST